MKIVICLLLSLALIVPSHAISCRTEPERCGEGECCVEFGIFGMCRPLLKEGEKCELKQLVSSFNKHVYLLKCPCAEGLTCEEDDSGSAKCRS
ncbi:peptide 1 isoform X2 [Parasteatoda tepidariorum]|uniref:peptide 1 isoform X2 n=1 Tax=Parasteatoda tepidariorum TaxID=114398 RepID=UPI00077FC824|nr:peptide 1 isoform X2 [Parasteatoda tepidariorum]